MSRRDQPTLAQIDAAIASVEELRAAAAERRVAMMISHYEEDASSAPKIEPVSATERSQNEMRPFGFKDVIGQENAKRMMKRVLEACRMRGVPLDHTLLVGAAGTGKTTFASVIANELGVDCYQLAAPVALDVLLELRETMDDGDVLFIDEIHQQAIMERRGKESISQPEVFLSLLEDRVIATGAGMLPFPHITVIGATTDPGRLPDPFLDRFPLQPHLAPYSEQELATIALGNADALGITMVPEAAMMFSRASRGVPRRINSYVKNGASLATRGMIDTEIAAEVVGDLNHTTPDGLDRHMQDLLVFLYTHCRREVKDEVSYQAGVSTIATAIGLSRDTKAVTLRVEPYLIARGLLQVGHGGRSLTDQGATRARELLEAT